MDTNPTQPEKKRIIISQRTATEASSFGTHNSREVVVTDIRMRFWSMVWFMVKWTIASIPALIILFLIGFLVIAPLIIGLPSFLRARDLSRQNQQYEQTHSQHQNNE